MIYLASIAHNYGSHLVCFVHTPNATVHAKVLDRADNVFVVDPSTVQVLKNTDGAHYNNDNHLIHQLAEATPLCPTAFMLIEEEELMRWVAAGCPVYYEWRWATCREYQP